MKRLFLAAAWPVVAAAQTPSVPQRARVEQSPADAAIAKGRFDEAESYLYAAARRSTREPSSRGALGLFLAARGRLLPGQTLLEEARQFGADDRSVGLRLAHIYAWSGSWESASRLASIVLTASERERARYLVQHPPGISGPDSVRVPLEPNELQGLGRITLAVGAVTLAADIDPAAEGIVLPSTVQVMGEVQTFGFKGDSTIAVAHTVAIGAMTLSNVATLVANTPAARIGLDVLWRLTPSFDLGSRTLVLRQKGTRDPAGATELPLYLTFPGVSVVAREGEGPTPLGGLAGRGAIRGARWTFDLARGAILVDR